jgi:hypothetical protein
MVNPLKLFLRNVFLYFTKKFVEVYNLCNKGPFPKSLKLSKDFQKEEVHELFGPVCPKMGIDIALVIMWTLSSV